MLFFGFKKWLVVAAVVLLTPALHADQEIFRVVDVKAGDSLALRAWPSPKSRIKIAIPHNASWVRKQAKSKQVGNSVWRQVRWNKVEGWVNERYLKKDARASWVVKKRLLCQNDAATANKFCCAFPAHVARQRYKPLKSFAVKSVRAGDTLLMRSAPGQGNPVVAIPHDAKWLTHLGRETRLPNGQFWAYIRWNGLSGWVNKAFLRYDAAETGRINQSRKKCMAG